MNIGSIFAINDKIETHALSVVGVQFTPIGAQTKQELEENVQTVLNYMDDAVGAFPGLDIIVFPEACFQGFAPVNFEEAIMEKNSPYIEQVKQKCKALAVWGVFNPLIWSNSRNCYENTAIVINNEGEIVHTYLKMNPWIPFENSKPGKECKVFNGPKGSRIGIIICADGDYPEIWREATYNGANIIIRPTHYMDPYYNSWEITNKAGAYFNQVYVVGVNTCGLAKNETRSCFGRSMIVGPDGNIITELSSAGVGLIKADLYPGLIDKIHEQSVQNNLMFSFNNRGASCPDYNGEGDTEMRYNAYKNGGANNDD